VTTAEEFKIHQSHQNQKKLVVWVGSGFHRIILGKTTVSVLL